MNFHNAQQHHTNTSFGGIRLPETASACLLLARMNRRAEARNL
jgi:hypothetical protein